MATAKAEAWTREKFIKIFKKYVGKGPRNAEVKIFKKMLIVIFQDVLTPLEKNLISFDQNVEEVEKLREGVSELALKECEEILINLTGDKIVEVWAKNNLTNDEGYYLFVFENNVEEILKNKENLA